ncbi:MAG: hypothetical protein AAFR41_13580 [Pseudomonadota bacterium]
MKRSAGLVAAFLFTVTSIGLPASAQTTTTDTGEDLILRLFGVRGWSVECSLEKARGEMSRPEARGRGGSSSGTIYGRDIVGGSCEARANARGPLEMTLVDDSEHFVCPFGDRDADAVCKGVLGAGQSIQFGIERS